MKKYLYVLLIVAGGVCISSCSNDNDDDNPPLKSESNQITRFVFKAADNEALQEDITAAIDQEAHTIIVNIPASIDETTLTPTIETSPEATVSSTDPAACSNEVVYTVTEQDGSQSTYTYTITYTATSDREALIALYKSNPCNTLSWDLNNEDISTWDGVSVNNQGRVSLLQEVDSGLVTLPAAIEQLTHLNSLFVHKNQFTSLPAEIGQLTKLENLDVKDNQLTSLPAEIGQLTNLEYLDVRDNQLTKLPAEIGQPTNLKLLYVDNNQLTELPAEIGNLTNLERLKVENNQLTSLPAAVCALETKYNTFINKDEGVVCE